MKRILLVDDEINVLDMLGNFLSEKYYVRRAENGNDALAILKNNDYDLLITDIFMPDSDGVSLICDAKTYKKDLKIIAMSGGALNIDKDKIKKIVMPLVNYFIRKPMDIIDMANKVDELLD